METLARIQTLLLALTFVAGAYAAKYALTTIRVQAYQQITEGWKSFSNQVYMDRPVLNFWRAGATGSREVDARAESRASDLFTTFDGWLVSHKLGTFPTIGGVDTWLHWHETVVGFFVRFPHLIEVHKAGARYWSAWLIEVREEAEKRPPATER